MGDILFCNIGWMSRYEGLKGRPDKIVGGGQYVTDNETGHEVCNFLACGDGFVYGHVETIQGKKDRKIRIETLGGSGDYVKGIDVIWTATDPDEGGRRIVGWYRNATVFRQRQKFLRAPSKQHSRDEIDSYRIRALAGDAQRLDLEDRTLALGRGSGWMGQTAWWAPSDSSSPEVRRFVGQARQLLDSFQTPNPKSPNRSGTIPNSPSAATNAYLRYVEAYEVEITPRHTNLQEKFEAFLASHGADDLRPNVASVDLRYRDASKGMVLAEVKPCELSNARYAIRTAMGQLLDYQQRTKEDTSLLIVLEKKPKDEDQLLATSNGFGVAYPVTGGFAISWPFE